MVALGVATSLERVVEPKPVPGLMRRGEAQVVVAETGNGAAGHRAERHVTPAACGRDAYPDGNYAQPVLAAVDRVDVQRIGATAAKRALERQS